MRWVSQFKDLITRRKCVYIILPVASLFCFIVFLGDMSRAQHSENVVSMWKRDSSNIIWKIKGRENKKQDLNTETQDFGTNLCTNRRIPIGSENLPSEIVVATSNFEQRPLYDSPTESPSKNLFVVTVGIKQKDTVNKMVKKFLSKKFSVMLFHYDGIVEGWNEFEWSNKVTHVAALNQTKWWFSKRFLHPDIVSEYNYIFLWDEDLGVENFDPDKYLTIIKEEGLEISQPALETNKSEVHHLITAQQRQSRVHRRIYKVGKDQEDSCDENSKAPPCTGWIEVMAPVFSIAAWRCAWYMIQNDMIHAWGLDMKLGYCAQGDRTRNIGVVDAEYIVHYGLPTLGDPNSKGPAELKSTNLRVAVRRQSYREYKQFVKRWQRAVYRDKCWKDPYPE